MSSDHDQQVSLLRAVRFCTFACARCFSGFLAIFIFDLVYRIGGRDGLGQRDKRLTTVFEQVVDADAQHHDQSEKCYRQQSDPKKNLIQRTSLRALSNSRSASDRTSDFAGRSGLAGDAAGDAAGLD